MVESVYTLQGQIAELQALCQQANPNGLTLQGQFLVAQQCFQNQVLPLGDRLDPSLAIQPILTEMNRSFRLLAMDVAFLQAARQPLKAQQRQRQMAEKLQQIFTFCQALSQRLAASSPTDNRG